MPGYAVVGLHNYSGHLRPFNVCTDEWAISKMSIILYITQICVIYNLFKAL